MYFAHVPSLERIALLKIAVTLRNQEDVKVLTKTLDWRRENLDGGVFSQFSRAWNIVEAKVKEKAWKLMIPRSLINEIISLVRNINQEILKWKEYHWNCLSNELDSINDVQCWAPCGSIDRKKTAGMLIKERKIDVVTRYKLACMYCLEDDVPILWKAIPRSTKKKIHRERDVHIVEQGVITYWTFFLKNELHKLEFDEMGQKLTPLHYAFACASNSFNCVAATYFYDKIPSTQKNGSLTVTASILIRRCAEITNSFRSYGTEVLCFLLSKMDESAQSLIFKYCSVRLLKCFLFWPFRDLFVPTACLMWNFLSEAHFDMLVNLIAEKGSVNPKDYSYQKVLQKFWQESPITHKKYVINNNTFGMFITNFLRITDTVTISLILMSLTDEQKEKLLFSDVILFNLFYVLVYGQNWNFFKFFVVECTSSQAAVMRMKNRVHGFLTSFPFGEHPLKQKNVREKIFQILDDIIEEYYDTEMC